MTENDSVSLRFVVWIVVLFSSVKLLTEALAASIDGNAVGGLLTVLGAAVLFLFALVVDRVTSARA